jgi:hypothetical protein
VQVLVGDAVVEGGEELAALGPILWIRFDQNLREKLFLGQIWV